MHLLPFAQFNLNSNTQFCSSLGFVQRCQWSRALFLAHGRMVQPIRRPFSSAVQGSRQTRNNSSLRPQLDCLSLCNQGLRQTGSCCNQPGRVAAVVSRPAPGILLASFAMQVEKLNQHAPLMFNTTNWRGFQQILGRCALGRA